MKYLFFLSFFLCFLSACTKEEEPAITICPPVDRVISTDTLTSGTLWGIQIGESASNTYSKIQSLSAEKRITYIGVVGNVFTDLSSIENSIPLYTSVFLDEAKGTESSIQLSFKEGRVSSIYTNAGVELNKWPANYDKSSSITKNDLVETIYSKLVNIKRMKIFEKKFERISIFGKDVSKAYDSNMSVSPQWYFRSGVDSKSYYLIHLSFNEGKLSSIYYTFYETP